MNIEKNSLFSLFSHAFQEPLHFGIEPFAKYFAKKICAFRL